MTTKNSQDRAQSPRAGCSAHPPTRRRDFLRSATLNRPLRYRPRARRENARTSHASFARAERARSVRPLHRHTCHLVVDAPHREPRKTATATSACGSEPTRRRRRVVRPSRHPVRVPDRSSSSSDDCERVPKSRRTSSSSVVGPAQFLCRAALSPPQLPLRTTASTAPVEELRRKSMFDTPLKSRAFTEVPSGRRTSVPAVT